MDHPYDKALDKIWNSINVTPPMHPSDFDAIVDLFDRNVATGKRVTYVDDIGDYLIKKGMNRDMARRIQAVYEVLEARVLTSTRSVWNHDAIKDLL